MARETYNPNAYLANLRNVKLGLRARTKILNALERESGDAKTLAKESELSYSVALYHLKLMRKTGVVLRKEGRPYLWVLTGLGQRRLVTTN